MNSIYKFLLISLISVFPLRAMEHAQLARQNFEVAGQLAQELLKQDLTPTIVALGAGLSAVSLAGAGIFLGLRIFNRSNRFPVTVVQPQSLQFRFSDGKAENLVAVDPLLDQGVGVDYRVKVELGERSRSSSDTSASGVLSLVACVVAPVTGGDSAAVSPRSEDSFDSSEDVRKVVSVIANESVDGTPKRVLQQVTAIARGRLKRIEQGKKDIVLGESFRRWRENTKSTKESKQIVHDILSQLIADLPEKQAVSVDPILVDAASSAISSPSSSDLVGISVSSDGAASACAAASSHDTGQATELSTPGSGKEKVKSVARELFPELPKVVEKPDKRVQYLDELARNRRAWKEYRSSRRRRLLVGAPIVGAPSSPSQEPTEVWMGNGCLNDMGARALDIAYEVCFSENKNPIFKPKVDVADILKSDLELAGLLRARQKNATLSREEAFKKLLHHIARVAPEKYFQPRYLPSPK